MLGRPLTHAETRERFDTNLNEAVTQGIYNSDQGFDNETSEALRELARQFPFPTDEAIENARQAIEFQLDGTHARQRLAKRRPDLR